jgi:hypothetical protein
MYRSLPALGVPACFWRLSFCFCCLINARGRAELVAVEDEEEQPPFPAITVYNALSAFGKFVT